VALPVEKLTGGIIRPMDEEAFWQVVAETRIDSGGNIADQPDALAGRLAALPVDEVLEFRDRLLEASAKANTNDMVEAAALLLGGVGDDSFEDFRSWLICHGREIFARAVADPDSIVELSFDDAEDDFGSAEIFSAVPSDLIRSIGGDVEVDDYPREPDASEWSIYDRDTLATRFPRLYGRAERLHGRYLRRRE
jgi:hypothetical protein